MNSRKNAEGYRNLTADQAINQTIKAAGMRAAGKDAFEGWMPPAVWKFIKSPLLVLSMMGNSSIVIAEDEDGFRYRDRKRK